MARALPGVAERLARGERSFLAGGRLFARLKDDRTLVVRTDPYEREHLVGTEPSVFYVTAQIRDHPWVFVRIAEVDAERLAALVRDAWCRVAPRRRVEGFEKGTVE